MAHKVAARPDMYCYETMNAFDWELPSKPFDDDVEIFSTDSDSSSEQSSPDKPKTQISPEKFPLSLKLNDPTKQFRHPKVNPDVAYLVRQSEWLQNAMITCGNQANDVFEKAVQARNDKEHEKAAQYDTRTNEYMFQYYSAAESTAKVHEAFRRGITVVSTNKLAKNKKRSHLKKLAFLNKSDIAGHERRGKPKLQTGIDFASEKAFPESGGKDARGEPMHLFDYKT
jgi:hypothetical protein